MDQNTEIQQEPDGAEPTADAVLAAAAATAEPGQAPSIEPQPHDLEALLATTAAVAGLNPTESFILRPMYSLDEARALPEIDGSVYVPHESDDPRAILAFKDVDGRTMHVAVTVHGLAKIAVSR